MKHVKCKDCGKRIGELEVFPKGRCLECHAKSPEIVIQTATMTGKKLARMWGAPCK